MLPRVAICENVCMCCLVKTSIPYKHACMHTYIHTYPIKQLCHNLFSLFTCTYVHIHTHTNTMKQRLLSTCIVAITFHYTHIHAYTHTHTHTHTHMFTAWNSVIWVLTTFLVHYTYTHTPIHTHTPSNSVISSLFTLHNIHIHTYIVKRHLLDITAISLLYIHTYVRTYIHIYIHTYTFAHIHHEQRHLSTTTISFDPRPRSLSHITLCDSLSYPCMNTQQIHTQKHTSK